MNTEGNQETSMEEDFKLPNHPFLSFTDDEFLAAVVKRLNSQIDLNDLQDFIEIMKELVFNGHDINELQQTPYCESSICSKCINDDEMYFICLDCDISPHPNIYSLFCEGCFDKSNHKGHRLFLMKGESGSANCDCGDAQSLKPEGFCSDHQSKPINIQELYKNFPQELRMKFERITKKSIYGAASLFELKQQELPEEVFNSLSELADELMSEMLNFWIECYSEVNRAFLPILWTTLRGQFDSHWDNIWHDCGDLQAENKNLQEPHQCTCSLLGNLFRISNLINKENQGKLKKILIECVKDRDFLEYLALEFAKYAHYFFTQNYDQEISEDDDETDFNSLLLDSYLHLYKEDDILGKVLDSGYFENFLNVIKKVVDKCTRVNLVTAKSVNKIRNILDYFLMPGHTSARRLAQDQKFMLQYLDIVMTYQMKFYYTDKLTTEKFDHQINYEALNFTLKTERRLCRSFENALKIIFDLPHEGIIQFLKHWYMSLQNAKAALKDENGVPYQSFDPCLERLFCCIIINYMKDDIETNNLEKFIKESFDGAHEVATNTIEGPLRALGMIRYLHLTFNYKSGPLFVNYYNTEKAFFEIDVVTTQMMVLLLKPGEGLFELLVENFFSYSPEIQGFFKDPKEENYEKKKLTMIEDFLYFLVFLMTDEICLLSIKTKYKKDNFGQIELNPRQRLVIKNLLVNILRGLYWTTTKHVTKLYQKFLTTVDQEIEQILLEVTVKDEKNHKIRIKDEYESGLNPYIFYRMPSVRQDVVETFTAKNSQKNTGFDLISAGGVLDSKDLPQYLKDIQIKLYQSNLPEFLIKYLKMANFKTGSTLIRLVLKLILLNLQVAEESEILKQKIEEHYVNDDFVNLINHISMEENFKDCKNCVENIKKVLQKFQKTDNMQVEESLQIQTKESEKKKLTAQERMAQLKQNFAQKQAAFAQNNQYLFQKSMSFQDSEESKRDEPLVCQHCMEKLHPSGKEYGLLINITFTNNFYDGKEAENFVEQDYTNFLKADWWPVISSCNHYYHRKCFEVFYKAPQKGFEKHFLSNAYEFFCPLCKGLCNSFLSISGEEKESDEMNQEVSQDELEKHPQIYQAFTKKIQKLLVDLKARIQLSPAGHATALEEASFVSIETIFERAYQYFVESFYLMENPQILEKSFKLYLDFFKGFKSYFKENSEHRIPEGNIQLSTFFNVNNLFLSTQASFPSKELNYKTEIYLTELLAKNLQKILATSDASGKSELLALKDFILFKVIQIIAFQDNPNMKLEDCFQLYQSNENLRSVILEQLAFPIQKIILSYALNISASSSSTNLNLSELFNLLQNTTFHHEEYLTDLFHTVNIPCSFPELILEIFQELTSRPKSEINFLSSLFDKQLFSKEVLQPHRVKFSPRIFQLPETFLEFNIKYYPKKCSLCKNFSTEFRLSICLICGEVMCTYYCNNDESQAGNLNRHSKKYHMGMGVFLDIQDLYQNLVNTPLNLNCDKTNLYVNKIGQDVTSFFYDRHPKEIAKLDFTEFKINQEYLKELVELINQQALRKDIVVVGLMIGEKTEDGFL